MTETATPSIPFRYRLEAMIARTLWSLFRALPVDMASTVGGTLLGWIGPLTKQHRIARRNLERAFPEKSPEEIDVLLRDMWNNLGRSLGEVPNMDRILDRAAGRVVVEGATHIVDMKNDGKPGLFASAHLANWEVGGLAVAREGLRGHVFYRAANNPLINELYAKIRSMVGGEQLPKGRDGARRALQLLKQGEHLGVMVDQKMNDGIAVPFFGRPAMTAPAIAQLAYRFDCPVIPVQVVRTGAARFVVTVHPPLEVSKDLPPQEAQYQMMVTVNTFLEDWIRQNPAQWLWVHRRWPD